MEVLMLNKNERSINRPRSVRGGAGACFYAVKTTGIYCRPGCPSRRPKPENVELFERREAAERAGYRPCKRCRPDATPPREEQARVIARACRSIESAETPPPLAELAAGAGLSPYHFHRLFKTTVGLTPKRYAAAHRMSRFREGLSKGGTVTDALYEAGFGSSSRAYDGVSRRLGMTPSTYREGGTDLDIHFAVTRCSLGRLLVAATQRGLCAIELGDTPEALHDQLRIRFPRARLRRASRGFTVWVKEVAALIEAPERGLSLPLDIRGTSFQQRVWEALREIPPGTTLSYGQLAERLGKPRAVRAVARACASNKLAVAIPCHRVVRRGGDLGGYHWGVQRKQLLLARENPGLRSRPSPRTAKPTGRS